jgi:hypothetical protein
MSTVGSKSKGSTFGKHMHRSSNGWQAGRVWNQHLHAGLTEKLGFIQREVDPCVYYRGTLVFLLYTEDSILISPDDSEIDRAVAELGKHFNVTDQGQIYD